MPANDSESLRGNDHRGHRNGEGRHGALRSHDGCDGTSHRGRRSGGCTHVDGHGGDP